MNQIIKGFLAASSCIFASAISHGQTAYTDPVGAMELTIEGTVGEQTERYSLISLPLLNPAEFSGEIDSVTIVEGEDSVLNDEEGTWADDDFVEANWENEALYFVEITSGDHQGLYLDILDTAAAGEGDAQIVVEDLSALDPAPSSFTYRIRKFNTIADVFGAEDPEGVLQGANADSADNLFLTGGNGWNLYYYKEPFGGIIPGGWRLNGGDPFLDVRSTRIDPNSGLLFNKKDSFSISILLTGDVKLGNSIVPMSPGANLVGYSFPVNTDLDNSGLVSLDENGDVIDSKGMKAGNSETADIVYLLSEVGEWDIYYFKAAVKIGDIVISEAGWRKSGDDPFLDFGEVEIKAGQAVIVLRREASGGGFYWQESQPFNLTSES